MNVINLLGYIDKEIDWAFFWENPRPKTYKNKSQNTILVLIF